MAIKKYIAKVTGTHAMTGMYLEQGKEYDIEETLAGSEILESVIARDEVPKQSKEEIAAPEPALSDKERLRSLSRAKTEIASHSARNDSEGPARNDKSEGDRKDKNKKEDK